MQKASNQNAARKLGTTEKPEWYEWRTKELHARCIRFIETYCIPSKGHTFGQPLKVAKWQMEWLEEVLAGEVSSSILSLGRGNGKSTFAGAVATWALHDPAVAEAFGGQPVIPVIAPTLQQAVANVYGAALAFTKANPELRDRTHIYTANGQQRLVVPHNYDGALFPLAAHTDHLQGLDPMLCLVDEVGFIPIEIWTALELASGKRPRNLVLGLGTKSPGESDNTLDHLTEAVRLQGHIEGFHLVTYEAPANAPCDDEDAWHAANPALAEGYLKADELRNNLPPKTPEPLYRCFRLNQKVAAVDGWLGVDGALWWDASVTTERTFDVGEPVFLGVDKSARGDLSAVVAIQQCIDVDAWYSQAKVFFPDKDGAINHRAVRDHIRDLCETYNVQAIGYDERYFVEGAQELEDEGLPMLNVPQTVDRMEPMYAELYQLILKGQWFHDDDPIYRSHVLSAVAMPTSNGGFMLKKNKSKNHIDAIVATAIALYASDNALAYNPSQYWVA